MVEQKQGAKISRRRSRAEVKQLVAEYEASGLNRTAFCRQRGLSLSTLVRHQAREKRRAGEAADGKRWLSVEVSGSHTVVSGEMPSGLAMVVPGGRRIEVGRGFDADTLQRLLAVVERS